MYDIHKKLTKIPMIVATMTLNGQMVHLIEKLPLLGYNITQFLIELSVLILFTRNQPFNPFEANIPFLYHTSGFLMFAGDIEMEHWLVMSLIALQKLKNCLIFWSLI